MRNYDFLFILVCFFILRIVVFSASYADAICLLSILAFKLGSKFLDAKKISSDLEQKVQTQDNLTNARLQALADEIIKVRNSAEGIKAAINLTKR